MLIMALTRGIKTKKAEGEALPFPDDSFGAVFILFTICFVRDPEKVLAEAKRVLKPGGGLIIGFINRESPWGELYMKKKGEGHPIYKNANFYTVGDIVTMIKKAGMKIKAFSSTLCQSPSEMPYKEPIHNDFVKDAGCVCILAGKIDSLGANDC
jgi:ubiquinone/menaquinone biosynthesis C-methylase UbiE